MSEKPCKLVPQALVECSPPSLSVLLVVVWVNMMVCFPMGVKGGIVGGVLNQICNIHGHFFNLCIVELFNFSHSSRIF